MILMISCRSGPTHNESCKSAREVCNNFFFLMGGLLIWEKKKFQGFDGKMFLRRFLLTTSASPTIASPAGMRCKSSLVSPAGVWNLCNMGGNVKDLLEREESENVSKEKLVRCAKHLVKKGQHEQCMSLSSFRRVICF